MTFHHSVETSLFAFAFAVNLSTTVKLTNTGAHRWCVCGTPVSKDLGPDAISHEKQGGSACLTVTAQRRHCQCMVISGLISQTYLLSD